MEENRKVSTIDAKKFCQQNGNMLFYESSAKNNVNVEVAFSELGAKAVKRQISVNPTTGQNERIQDTKRMQLEAAKKKKK